MTPPPPCRRCGQPIPTSALGGECPACLILVSLGSGADEALPALTPADIERHLPDLEILSALGRGGMGVVYKARQKTLDRVVAVKVLAPDRAADPSFAERFVREARAMARISHPNVVGVYDVVRVGDLVLIVMEYVDGASLRDRLRTGRVPPTDALRLIPQLCEALQYAHDHGVVHRDIKPENVLIDSAGTLKLTDFGLAKFGAADGFALTDSGDCMGTVRYMAPEQWADTAGVDHRADIYSLGVLLYEMLTGDLPTPQFTPPSAKVGTDPRFDHVVSKSMRDEPAERYQSAGEVKSDVARIAAPIRRRWPIVAVGIGLLVVGVVAVWLRYSPAWIDPSVVPLQPDRSLQPLVSSDSRTHLRSTRTPAEILTSPDWEWMPPENFGPAVNTTADEGTPAVSQDGRAIVFHSNRPGGEGGADLWISQRDRADEPFGIPTNLGPGVNSSGHEADPWVTADGRTLLFVTVRKGTGDTDIWVSHRADPQDEWGPAESLGPRVNSRHAEYRPTLSDDGLVLTFHSLRPPANGTWVARRAATTVPFGEPVPLGKDPHRRYLGGVSFAAGGRVVLCNRLNRVFPDDLLWVGLVDDPDEPFRGLVSFGPVVNAGAVNVNPVASADGRTVYFQAERSGGYGGTDLWLTRRVPRQTPSAP